MKTSRLLLTPLLAAGLICAAPPAWADPDATAGIAAGATVVAGPATPSSDAAQPTGSQAVDDGARSPQGSEPATAPEPGSSTATAVNWQARPAGDPAPAMVLEQGNARAPEEPLPADGPNVQLGQGGIPAGRTGDVMDVQIPLKNWGRQTATNIRVTPQLAAEAANFPFEITQTDYTVGLNELAAGQAGSVTVPQLRLRAGLSSGYYRMPLTIEYDDGQRIRLVSTAMFVQVEGVAQPAPEAPGPVTILPPPTIEIVQQISGEAAASGGGQEYPAANPPGAAAPASNAESGGSAAGATPRVMLIGFGTNPAEVQAGSEFTLGFTLQNMSTRTGVENLKVSLSSPDASFLPTGGASSAYIDAIGTEQTANRQLTFRALPTLEDRPYQLTLRVEYEDSSNHQQFTAEETIAVVVRQKARPETGAFQVVPSSISVGQDANINFNLQNQGRVKLFNARVRVKEGQPVTATELFVGNVEAGAATSVDLMVHAEKATTKPVVIQIQYEDSSGVAATLEREVTLDITEGSGQSPSPTPQQSTSGGGFGLLPLMLLALAIVAAIVIIYVVRDRRKRERETQLSRNLSQLDDEPIFPVDPQ